MCAWGANPRASVCCRYGVLTFRVTGVLVAEEPDNALAGCPATQADVQYVTAHADRYDALLVTAEKCVHVVEPSLAGLDMT